MDLLGSRLVSRLLLSFFIAHDALVGTVRWPGLRLWHALLAAVFAALILHTFAIKSCFAIQRLELLRRLSLAANAVRCGRVP